MHGAELYKALELLDEEKDEATKMNDKDFDFKYVVHQLLQRLKKIDEAVALNSRIIDDVTYMIFLEEMHKTTEKHIKLDIEYTQKAIFWLNEWLSEKYK